MEFYTLSNIFCWLYWDPNPVCFVIPVIDWPIAWYGVFFVTGFALAYLLVQHLFRRKLAADTPLDDCEVRNTATILGDKILWYTVIGTLIGARLGHVFFYSWPHYRENLWEIPMTWQGGLASHGGAIGIITALVAYSFSLRKKLPTFTFLAVLDRVVITAAVAGTFIRMGNFWNQEILGVRTTVPWAIIFGHPFDGTAPQPRHPVQLYEGLCYAAIFVVLYTVWRRVGEGLRDGIIAGWFFVLVFGSRFLLEFLKMPLSMYTSSDAVLQMGQWLSIPFIVVGVFLIARPGRARRSDP